MKAAAATQDYEQAARLRDDLGALTSALERSAVVLGDATDADVFALADDELEAAVQDISKRTGEELKGLRRHVASCSACQETLRELSHAVDALDRLQPELRRLL